MGLELHLIKEIFTIIGVLHMIGAPLHNIMQISGALEYRNSSQVCPRQWGTRCLKLNWTVTV